MKNWHSVAILEFTKTPTFPRTHTRVLISDTLPDRDKTDSESSSMSDLAFAEKIKLEKLFNMGSGYVLDFSDRTFQDFVGECVGIDIEDRKYFSAGSSKAKRLRTLWSIEPNHIVGRLLRELVQLIQSTTSNQYEVLIGECNAITDRLLQGAPVLDVLTFCDEVGEKAFQALVRSLRQAINTHEPECALDRLHTYVVKYIRSICAKYGLETDREKPLHSLVGEYIKRAKAAGRIESEMTERILKSTISVMESFNRVRNEHSLAHDNPILSFDESLLIFNHITFTVRFIESIERTSSVSKDVATGENEEGKVPF